MSEPTPLSLSPTESNYYARLFKAADVSKQGHVLPQDAVTFLSKSKLPLDVLGKVWIFAFICITYD